MTYQELCEHCGHKTTAYTHKLNKMLVSALRQLVDFYEENKRPANLDKELSLTHNQLANFQKLQYWGLVWRGGNGWLPTPLGGQFIRGVAAVRSHAMSLNGKSVDFDHPAWDESAVRVQRLRVKDVCEDSYKDCE